MKLSAQDTQILKKLRTYEQAMAFKAEIDAHAEAAKAYDGHEFDFDERVGVVNYQGSDPAQPDMLSVNFDPESGAVRHATHQKRGPEANLTEHFTAGEAVQPDGSEPGFDRYTRQVFQGDRHQYTELKIFKDGGLEFESEWTSQAEWRQRWDAEHGD